MYVLEAATPLSRSMVWHLQRTFYADQGIEAWTRSGVPQSVTNSPNLARAYARIVSSFLHDLRASLDPTQPVYIVELGAGSGRLAYRFLKAFAELHEHQTQPVVYVLTDASPPVIDYWRDNPRLRPFIAAGVLDFARFDLLEPGPLELLNSGTTLSLETVGNPVVVFANYIFDSIPQDAYTIKGGQLFANLVTVSASHPELDLKAPDSQVRIGIGFTTDPEPTDIDAEPDPVVRELLRTYSAHLDDTTLLIPRAAMACVRHFKDMGRGRGLCVISDFGDTREDELPAHGPPGFGAGGGLWLAVNFHALGAFARGLGGPRAPPAQPTHSPEYVAAAVRCARGRLPRNRAGLLRRDRASRSGRPRPAHPGCRRALRVAELRGAAGVVAHDWLGHRLRRALRPRADRCAPQGRGAPAQGSPARRSARLGGVLPDRRGRRPALRPRRAAVHPRALRRSARVFRNLAPRVRP